MILVRHSLSRQDPGVSAHRWILTEEGRERCATLARRLYPRGIVRVYASNEPKAQATGELLAEALGGLPCILREGLRETRREKAPYFRAMEDFRAAIRTAMERPEELVFGEETFADAGRRLSREVDRIALEAGDGSVAVVTHGTVMALFLSRVAGLDAYGTWLSLSMPAYARLSLPGLELQELVLEI